MNNSLSQLKKLRKEYSKSKSSETGRKIDSLEKKTDQMRNDLNDLKKEVYRLEKGK